VTGRWRQWAACARPGVNPDLFYPEKGQSGRAAKAICARCPVARQCLDDALASPAESDHGVRAGTSPKQRRLLRRAS
jgi:WhiB family redox-sensing transcriptional regulator